MSSQHLEGAMLKIARARHHILELEQKIEAYRQTQPYSLSPAEFKPGDAVAIRLPEKIPPDLSVIAGDVLHNLRSALDHLAYQLAVQNGAENISDVYFPFWRDVATFNSTANERLKKFSNDAQTFISGLSPYPSGNSVLWTLHQLNIIDKHRLLIFVSGRGTMTMVQNFEPYGDSNIPNFGVSNPIYNNSFQFTFDVSLHEPEEYVEPVTITLQRMADMVSTILNDANARFFGQNAQSNPGAT